MRCPVCRADNERTGTCRRCKADLSLLVALEEQRDHALAAARAALARTDPQAALAHVAEAEQLRIDADSSRLAALAHLLAGNFAQAWRRHAVAIG